MPAGTKVTILPSLDSRDRQRRKHSPTRTLFEVLEHHARDEEVDRSAKVELEAISAYDCVRSGNRLALRSVGASTAAAANRAIGVAGAHPGATSLVSGQSSRCALVAPHAEGPSTTTLGPTHGALSPTTERYALPPGRAK
jgi:hypothetical protein